MWNTTLLFLFGRSTSDDQETVNQSVTSDQIVDTSQHKFPNEIWGIRSTWEVVLKIGTIVPIVIMGILGNSGLIYVIKSTPSLHTTTNLLIANIAIADLGTVLFCPWMLLCTDLFQNYILGPVGCRIDGFLTHALTLVAVFSLSTVSYDRVTAIVLSCVGKLSQRATRILLCATWVAGVTLATPLVYFRHYRTRQWIDFTESYCAENFLYLASYWYIFIGISVWAPLAIMAVCYSAILIKLDKYETAALKSKNPIAVKYKGRVARILALVVVVFILCRVPFTILILQREQLLNHPVNQHQADAIHKLWYVSRYLVILNAAVNPILYGCTNRSLRQALALRPATAWVLKIKKMKSVQKYNAAESRPDRRGILKPRSPCFHSDNQQKPIPNISSRITPNACTA